MNALTHHLTAEQVLRDLGQDDAQALHVCIRVFAPLLFALAERAQVGNVEEAVAAVLRDLETHHLGWPRSRLSARVWVTGMAQRRFQLLNQPAVAA